MKKFIILSTIYYLLSSPLLIHASESTIRTSTATLTVKTEETFTRMQNPEVNIYSNSSFFQKITSLISNNNHVISIKDPSEKTIINQTINPGENKIIIPSEQFALGNYQVIIDNQVITDFSWGVLAINTNKSIYQRGDLAHFSLAVLDERGEMICDAELNLSIKDPQGLLTNLSTKTGEVIINPECRSKDITSKPDYATDYQVKGDGIYSLSLSSTVGGTTTVLKDSFIVDSTSLFDVERITATRIFPHNLYPVTIRVTSKIDIVGTFTEVVPANFAISSPTSWPLNLKSGETTTFQYFYDAPDISPEYYLLGPAKIIQNNQVIFTEYRPWQIASDAIGHEQTVTGHAEASSITVGSASITGVSNQLYLAAISEKGNYTVSSVTGLGLTWSLVKAQCSGRAQTRTEIWSALGTVSGDGVVTATFSSAPIESVIAVSRYSGINTSSPIGSSISKNSVGINDVTCTGGTDASSYTVDLTTTVNNSFTYGAVSLRSLAHSATGSNSEKGEVHSTGSGGNQAGVAVEDQTTTTAGAYTVSGSISAIVDYAVVAVEIKPFVSSTSNVNIEGIKLEGININ